MNVAIAILCISTGLIAFAGAALGAYLAVLALAKKFSRPVVLDGLGIFTEEAPDLTAKRQQAKNEMGSEYILAPGYRLNPRHVWRA